MPESIPARKIERILAKSTISVEQRGKKMTVLHATLPNGFEIVEFAGCNNPDDFDLEIGKEICMEKLRDTVWAHEAYALHDALATS